MSATPFTIAVDDATLADLRSRLTRTRWPDAVDAAGWDYGTDPTYLRELVSYWAVGFDWSSQQRRLNRFANFTADIDGLHVHFVHERAKSGSGIPILLLHGWPSSFVQMLDIIPLLTNPADPNDVSFDVVVASLPGFGFSSRPTERGWSVARMAPLFHKLMTGVLGYERYAVRGGDLGAGVLTQMALLFPDAIVGMHTGGTNPWLGEIPNDLSPAEQQFVAAAQAWSYQEMAYAMEQSSKPQTLAPALNDSPAGLAAWIIEKFRRWSDCDGDLELRFSKDELLTNLTIYWATQTIGSSMRLYYESARDPGQWGRSPVPTAFLMSSKDMFPTPRSWIERSNRIDRWTEIDRGGHFLEWEEPEIVAADLRAFLSPLI